MAWRTARAALLISGAIIAVSAHEAPAADPAAGQKVFARCKQCHTLEPGKNKIGPSLAGVFGRKAGAVAGFNYSAEYPDAGMKGLSWNEEALDKYLANPRKFLVDYLGKPDAKTRMVFMLPKADERANIIAYLRQNPN
ncbi:MAG TPA: c-type cytochrome [Alphaproteobacteria bacterium]|jgi:cytochrome c|nr:c-type cytochrome [Alphaproteobacteria bacterium]